MCSRLWCWWLKFSSDDCAFWGLGGGGSVVEERERDRGYGHKHADNALCLN
jgi:hypothetical protein